MSRSSTADDSGSGTAALATRRSQRDGQDEVNGETSNTQTCNNNHSHNNTDNDDDDHRRRDEAYVVMTR